MSTCWSADLETFPWSTESSHELKLADNRFCFVLLVFLILTVKILNAQVETFDVVTSPLRKGTVLGRIKELVLKTTPVIYHFSPFPHPRTMQDGCLPWRQTLTRCIMVKGFFLFKWCILSCVMNDSFIYTLVCSICKNLFIIWISKYPSVWYSEWN